MSGPLTGQADSGAKPVTAARAVDDRFALLLALAAALLWSTVATAFKLSLRYLDVVQLLLLASVVSSICLYLILLGRGMGAAPWRRTRRDYLRCALLGLLNPFSYYLVLFQSYHLLPAQIAQAVNYTWAITLTLLSVPLLKHRIHRREWTALIISYAGVVIVCLGRGGVPSGSLSMTGIALALGSTVLWALYWIGKAGDPLDPVVSLFLSFLFSLPFTAALCMTVSSLPHWSLGWVGAMYTGLFEMGVTYVLWLGALRCASSPARVSNVIFLSPFVSLVFIHYLVGEQIPAATVGGLGLIVGGLLMQRKKGRSVRSDP